MSRQEIKNMTWKIARWLGEDRIVHDKNETIDSMTHHSEPVEVTEGVRVWPRYEFDDAAFGRLVLELPEGTEIQIGEGEFPTHYVKGPEHGNGSFQLKSGDDLKTVLAKAAVLFIEKGYQPRKRK